MASQTRTNVGRGLILSVGNWIGWLWFAIGGSHVSDRLTHPHHQRKEDVSDRLTHPHHQRKEETFAERGRGSYFN